GRDDIADLGEEGPRDDALPGREADRDADGALLAVGLRIGRPEAHPEGVGGGEAGHDEVGGGDEGEIRPLSRSAEQGPRTRVVLVAGEVDRSGVVRALGRDRLAADRDRGEVGEGVAGHEARSFRVGSGYENTSSESSTETRAVTRRMTW